MGLAHGLNVGLTTGPHSENFASIHPSIKLPFILVGLLLSNITNCAAACSPALQCRQHGEHLEHKAREAKNRSTTHRFLCIALHSSATTCCTQSRTGLVD
jgi:hypothetical protein